MKARLLPVYFSSGMDEEYRKQVATLRELLREEAEILDPVPLGTQVSESDALLFPQVLGEAYRSVAVLEAYRLPVLVVTSPFGTMNMWDWEIVTYLRHHGIQVFAPYALELTRSLVRTFAFRRRAQQAKFLVFQDNPGEGMQAEIFKRFFWWETECRRGIQERFGIETIVRSFRELGEQAKSIPDAVADAEWARWRLPVEGITERSLRSAVKLYLALSRELETHGDVLGMGVNCLNESFFSDTTPCLAWDMLFEERNVLWACEADTLSLLTECIVYFSLQAPVMMTNIYPFLMGEAALRHERIDRFPDVPEPEHHALCAHCGYLGVLPRPFAASWCVRRKVLRIVDDNAIALDARLPEGQITLVKLHPSLAKMVVAQGYLEGYVQYPGSDCENGALIRVRDGYRLVEKLPSHHVCLVGGAHAAALRQIAQVLGLEVEEI
ncbi:MAG: hypothetical protein N2205_06730 [Candidatus Caldatribacterium sp.]|uniref:hypothetical protein n=1 Tax=Candidatus Caldatribacterium sp. TaxID=2282143 RepID=UPI0037EEBA59|nr:hypothetical protein [Candidatus Caldatribacterium sp.]MCX7730894.1 hypothetical protein [Candidatus Caldatribacterium sp.]